MGNIIGLKFTDSGKLYCFSTEEGVRLRKGEEVVVESELGISIGRVVVDNFPPDKLGQHELKPILRKVTEADRNQAQENSEVAAEAYAFCNERIAARNLPMKLLTVEVTLDRKRFLFYFSAEERIDFRELVKDLASKYRTRIELRQIGVRDAARMIGGMGVCGREFCCRSFLQNFAPISIKMAKQQDLVLNTCKLSGTCGRLMCCLSYEYDEKGPMRRKPRHSKPEEAPPAVEATVEAKTEVTAELTAAPAVAQESQPQREERPREARPKDRPRDRDRGGRDRDRNKDRSKDQPRREAQGDRPPRRQQPEQQQAATPVQERPPVPVAPERYEEPELDEGTEADELEPVVEGAEATPGAPATGEDKQSQNRRRKRRWRKHKKKPGGEGGAAPAAPPAGGGQ